MPSAEDKFQIVRTSGVSQNGWTAIACPIHQCHKIHVLNEDTVAAVRISTDGGTTYVTLPKAATGATNIFELADLSHQFSGVNYGEIAFHLRWDVAGTIQPLIHFQR